MALQYAPRSLTLLEGFKISLNKEVRAKRMVQQSAHEIQ
jgi:hypothetical protein